MMVFTRASGRVTRHRQGLPAGPLSRSESAVFLAEVAPSALVVRAAGVEPAQRLRTEGF